MDRRRRKPTETAQVAMKRRSLNLLNFLFTCCVLIAAIKIANGDFTARINKISVDLNKALGDALELDGPNYTDLFKNSTYYSKNAFNPKGMVGLYNITTKFMDLIMPEDIYPEGKFFLYLFFVYRKTVIL